MKLQQLNNLFSRNRETSESFLTSIGYFCQEKEEGKTKYRKMYAIACVNREFFCSHTASCEWS
jgi:hypothetical protein